MKNKNLVFSGTALAAAGVTVLLSESIGIPTSKVLVPILFIVGGIFAFLFSRDVSSHIIGRPFYMLQGCGMVLFGLLVATIPDSLESFLSYVSYFVMCFGFLEIVFGFMSFNTGLKIQWNILIFRFITGFLAIIGAAMLLFTSMTDPQQGLILAGILMIIAGIGFIVFAQKLKTS